MTLEAGDIILTGTPSGVGPLSAGDEVVVEIEGIGRLVNGVKPMEIVAMTDNRFQDSLFKPSSKWIPLAERMRPRTLDEIVGQDKAFGKGTLLAN